LYPCILHLLHSAPAPPRIENPASSIYNTNHHQSRELPVKITREDVLYVARLARLEIEDSAVDRFALQIGRILEYVEQLNELDTTGVRPTAHALALTNVMREDAARPHLEREAALANAPRQEDGCFLVPKIVG
jgi:aspartyl-tRNA(Asn)/glutamyl-tRNA(Gln) amidotransferase subunit C